MEKKIHLMVFILAVIHIIFKTEWFVRVALGFMVFTTINFISDRGSRRCKTAVIAAVLLFMLTRGMPWFPVLPLAGLFLVMAVYP